MPAAFYTCALYSLSWQGGTAAHDNKTVVLTSLDKGSTYKLPTPWLWALYCFIAMVERGLMYSYITVSERVKQPSCILDSTPFSGITTRLNAFSRQGNSVQRFWQANILGSTLLIGTTSGFNTGTLVFRPMERGTICLPACNHTDSITELTVMRLEKNTKWILLALVCLLQSLSLGWPTTRHCRSVVGSKWWYCSK